MTRRDSATSRTPGISHPRPDAGNKGRTMLFLVVSTPRPEKPAEVAQARQSFWPWIGRHQTSGACVQVYARVGRGAVAIFDVESNAALHVVLNEWADIIPAHFDIYPLIDRDTTQRVLAAHARP
jgi:hypothetical protein